jgi:hypothetical protein
VTPLQDAIETEEWRLRNALADLRGELPRRHLFGYFHRKARASASRAREAKRNLADLQRAARIVEAAEILSRHLGACGAISYTLALDVCRAAQTVKGKGV